MISEVGALVKFNTVEAREKLDALLVEHVGRADRVATAIGVSRRTLDRWLARLGLLERAAEIRAKMGEKEPPT